MIGLGLISEETLPLKGIYKVQSFYQKDLLINLLLNNFSTLAWTIIFIQIFISILHIKIAKKYNLTNKVNQNSVICILKIFVNTDISSL